MMMIMTMIWMTDVGCKSISRESHVEGSITFPNHAQYGRSSEKRGCWGTYSEELRRTPNTARLDFYSPISNCLSHIVRFFFWVKDTNRTQHWNLPLFLLILAAKHPTDKYGTKIYCEDYRLSLQRPGMPYRALRLPPLGTPTFGFQEVRQVVDWASAFVDLHTFSGSGDSTRKALGDLRERRRAAEPVVRALLAGM